MARANRQTTTARAQLKLKRTGSGFQENAVSGGAEAPADVLELKIKTRSPSKWVEALS